MSKIVIAAPIYWVVCIVICWMWLITGYVKAVKRGNQIHSRMIWDFLTTAIFAPMLALFIIGVLGCDLLYYINDLINRKKRKQLD